MLHVCRYMCILILYTILVSRIDGCCRHVAASLFDIMEFQADNQVSSVTSGICCWKQRVVNQQSAVSAMELPSALDTSETSRFAVQEDAHRDLDDTQIHLPPVLSFIESVKHNCPQACMLDACEIRKKEVRETMDLSVPTPSEKFNIFLSCHQCQLNHCSEECFEEFETFLHYSQQEISHIEEATRGQHLNTNWLNMRKHLLTSSIFKKVCHSRNEIKTAISLLNGATFSEDSLPQHIEFGRRFEDKARNQFLKAHKYEHKSSNIIIPGLMMNSEYPLLGASPDGILLCDKCGGKALVEIKCISSKRNFQPCTALLLTNVAEKRDGNIVMNVKHSYYYQIQGQMAISGIKKCHVVAYTHKGIHVMTVPFDHEFWGEVSTTLNDFYKNTYFHIQCAPYILQRCWVTELICPANCSALQQL